MKQVGASSELPKYRVVSLFSGAMGFDLGLEATGRFETLATLEFDNACCDTIRLNRDLGRTARRDMRVLEGDTIRKCGIEAREITCTERGGEIGFRPGCRGIAAHPAPCADPRNQYSFPSDARYHAILHCCQHVGTSPRALHVPPDVPGRRGHHIL